VVTDAGGQVLDVVDLSDGKRRSLRYCVRKGELP